MAFAAMFVLGLLLGVGLAVRASHAARRPLVLRPARAAESRLARGSTPPFGVSSVKRGFAADDEESPIFERRKPKGGFAASDDVAPIFHVPFVKEPGEDPTDKIAVFQTEEATQATPPAPFSAMALEPTDKLPVMEESSSSIIVDPELLK